MYQEEIFPPISNTELPFLRNVDILKIASLLDYNINYAFAYFISQDSLILKSIVARHGQIEELLDSLLKSIEDDPLACEDSLYELHQILLREFKILNKTITATIKARALYDSEIAGVIPHLQDLCKQYSKIFKGLIDAYMQRSSQITELMIQQSAEFYNHLYKIEELTNFEISTHFATLTQILCKLLQEFSIQFGIHAPD